LSYPFEALQSNAPPGIGQPSDGDAPSFPKCHYPNPIMQRAQALIVSILLSTLSGCAVVTVADAAVTVVATGVKVAAKTVGAVADAVIPDEDDEKKD
jgi:hypothetical protein